MMWYAFYGDTLESFLFWTARGREPPAGYADDDEDGDGGWPEGWIEDYHGNLPRRFVALTSTWLRLRPGRHLITEAGDYNSIAMSVVELEAQLRSLFERRISRS